MTLFSLISIVFIIFLILVDSIFVHKKARKALRWMTVFYLFLLVFIIFQGPFNRLAQILELGRPADLIIYFATVFLGREFFLSRQRYYLMNQQITALARENAINSVKKYG